MSGVSIVSSSSTGAATGAPCNSLNVNTCTTANGSLATGGYATALAGTFTLAPATAVPTLTGWNLLLLGGLLVLTAAVVVRRRQAA